MEKIIYRSTGYVLGNYWGGGKGAYAAKKLSSEISKEDLIEQNRNALNNGSLDSGMGYESLIGAGLYIETLTEIEHNGKTFSNSEFEYVSIGELTNDEEDFLFDLEY
jgi:hypothetical protein